jgi:inner membrane protein
VDTLTHGLFGVAVAALRRPEGGPDGARLGITDRAVFLGCLIASELPDLDYLWPTDDAITATLRAHRGLSHALVATPVIALVAAGIAKAVYRRARVGPIYLYAMIAFVFAHLLPDLWTGWGTRIFLPMSDARMTLDWTVVVDPLVTLPMLVATVWAWRARRASIRRVLASGLAVTAIYVMSRVAVQQALTASVREMYGSDPVRVFPAPLSVLSWRYVATLPDGYAAGVVALGRGATEQRRVTTDVALLARARALPQAQEILAWARWPVLEERPSGSGQVLSIGDLRYHLDGQPTLRFLLELDDSGKVTSARLDRGASMREMISRWRR